MGPMLQQLQVMLQLVLNAFKYDNMKNKGTTCAKLEDETGGALWFADATAVARTIRRLFAVEKQIEKREKALEMLKERWSSLMQLSIQLWRKERW